MKTPASTFIKFAAASCVLAFAGCLTNENVANQPSEGGNAVFAQEGASMAAALDSGSIGDTAAGVATHERIVVPLAYDSACGCFTRTSSFADSANGLSRTRADSIWLYANDTAITDSFAPASADSIVHVRHVTRSDGSSGNATDFTIATTLVRRDTDSGTVYVWTGTISGTLNGQTLAGSTFTLTRTFVPGEGFGRPCGGMFIRRGPRDLFLDFAADGSATATLKKMGRVIRVSHIDKDGDES